MIPDLCNVLPFWLKIAVSLAFGIYMLLEFWLGKRTSAGSVLGIFVWIAKTVFKIKGDR